MTIYLPCLDDEDAVFPDVSSALAVPNGLLAFGGELSPKRILNAYQRGIFPWFSDDEPILWWSPNPRAIIHPADFQPSKSLRKHLRKSALSITLNHATEQVIQLCATTRPPEQTWITQEMIEAYIQLAQLGHCHSVEVWRNDKIIGGLYGLKLGKVFCGESMFSLESNASKLAFWHLCEHLTSIGGEMIDCQMMNPHLATLGVIEILREDFIKKLNHLSHQATTPHTLERQVLFGNHLFFQG